MKTSRVILAVLGVAVVATLVAVALASPRAAVSGTGKSLIQIDSVAEGPGTYSGTFNLELVEGASLVPKSDKGTLNGTARFGADVRAPDGQLYDPMKGADTLKGKAGGLVIRWSGRIYDVAGPHAAPGAVEVWLGTWSIARGTGTYAGLTGGGRWFALNTVCCKLTRRFTGFVAKP